VPTDRNFFILGKNNESSNNVDGFPWPILRESRKSSPTYPGTWAHLVSIEQQASGFRHRPTQAPCGRPATIVFNINNITADAADFYSCGGCGLGVALRSC